MRTVLLFILAPIVLVVGGFALFLLSDNTALLQDNPACGLRIAEDLPAGSIDRDAKWTAVSYDGTGTLPRVLLKELSPSAIAAPDPAARGCGIEISGPAARDTKGADWRIGRTIDMTGLRGQTIMVRFSIRARAEGKLPAGTVYVYDGQKLAGLPVHELTAEWESYEIVYAVPEHAEQLELWFRLFFDRPEAVPESNEIFFTAAILPVPDRIRRYAETPACGLQVAAELSAPAIAADAKWSVFAADGTGTGPDVATRALAAADLAAPGGQAAGCEMDILALGGRGTTGADWRIGRTVDARELHGKSILVRFAVKARDTGSLPQGTVYVYDGRKVHGIPLQQVGPDWTNHDIAYDVPADVDQFEIWFRLFHGTPVADPAANRLNFSAALLPAPGAAAPTAD